MRFRVRFIPLIVWFVVSSLPRLCYSSHHMNLPSMVAQSSIRSEIEGSRPNQGNLFKIPTGFLLVFIIQVKLLFYYGFFHGDKLHAFWLWWRKRLLLGFTFFINHCVLYKICVNLAWGLMGFSFGREIETPLTLLFMNTNSIYLCFHLLLLLLLQVFMLSVWWKIVKKCQFSEMKHLSIIRKHKETKRWKHHILSWGLHPLTIRAMSHRSSPAKELSMATSQIQVKDKEPRTARKWS